MLIKQVSFRECLVNSPNKQFQLESFNVSYESDEPEGFGDAKVSQLEQLVGGDEDVLRLDVAMQDVLLVEILQREADLD
jgi:hypothetical protein